MVASTDPVRLVMDNRHIVHAHLARSFRRLPQEIREELIQDTLIELTLRVRRGVADPSPIGLACCIAWRLARARHRRTSTRVEFAMEEPMRSAQVSPGQHAWLTLGRMAALVDEASGMYGGSQVDEIRESLEYRLIRDCTDRHAAERFGVHRSQLTRARLHVRAACMNA